MVPDIDPFKVFFPRYSFVGERVAEKINCTINQNMSNFRAFVVTWNLISNFRKKNQNMSNFWAFVVTWNQNVSNFRKKNQNCRHFLIILTLVWKHQSKQLIFGQNDLAYYEIFCCRTFLSGLGPVAKTRAPKWLLTKAPNLKIHYILSSLHCNIFLSFCSFFVQWNLCHGKVPKRMLDFVEDLR